MIATLLSPVRLGTISIALCCCNGAAYLDTQLQSLARQTRRPDELVVCDDHSDDDTCQRVVRFARHAPFPVRLVINPVRLGVTRNFNQAISLCQGELIALCDQDDRWHPAKLQYLEDALAVSPNLGYVWCNADLVGESLRPTGRRLWDILGPGPRQRELMLSGRGMEVLVRNNVVTGAMMLFRAPLRDVICPIPDGWLHDAWIALVLTAMGDCAMVDRSLVDYRQHDRQQIGARRNGLLRQMETARRMEQGYFQQDLSRWDAALDRLEQCRGRLPRPEVLSLVKERRDHARRRLEMRERPDHRWELAAAEVWAKGYGRFALGWKSLLQDALLKME